MFRRAFGLRCAAVAASPLATGASPAAHVTSQLDKYAKATRVKQHCTMALAKFKSGHPMLFLQRGRAYIELGQPYFALADFNSAARHENVPHRYFDLAHDLIAASPDEQVAYFESADNHLSLLVKPFLGEGAELRTTDGKGRGVFASEDLVPGATVVKRTQNYLTYPLEDGRCASCGVDLGIRSFACKNDDCHEEYCSRECRNTAGQLYHSGVCHMKNFQNMELELYSKLKSVSTSSNDYLSTAAFLLLLRVYGVSVSTRIIPSALPAIRSLSGRMMFSAQTLSKETLELYQRIAAASKTETTVCYEEFITVLAKLTANVFVDDGCIYVHVPRAMMNHSCDPNTMLVGGEFVASRAVSAGEELTITYYPAITETKPYSIRRPDLEKRGFFCKCAKCLAQK